MNIYSIILDISVLIVLCITIVFCYKLNNKIIHLKASKDEMEKLIQSFDTIVINANNSIINLKETTEKANITRQNYLKEANDLANDLSIMISSGNRLIQSSDEAMKALEDLLIKINSLKDQVSKTSNVEKISNIKNKIN